MHTLQNKDDTSPNGYYSQEVVTQILPLKY